MESCSFNIHQLHHLRMATHFSDFLDAFVPQEPNPEVDAQLAETDAASLAALAGSFMDDLLDGGAEKLPEVSNLRYLTDLQTNLYSPTRRPRLQPR